MSNNTMRVPLARLSAGLATLAALLAGGAATAAAHVHVAPPVVAPGDAVRFQVEVPGERPDAGTTKVVLQVPLGVTPRGYGETPGWSRRIVRAEDGSVSRIVWTGRAAPEGVTEFSFLAATPTRPGTIAWKALQHYSDGSVVRWIGAPDSEYPAAETEVVAGQKPRDAGGGQSRPDAHGAGDEDTHAPGESQQGVADGEHASGEEADATVGEASSGEDADSGDDGPALILAIAALALVGVALAVALRRRRSP